MRVPENVALFRTYTRRPSLIVCANGPEAACGRLRLPPQPCRAGRAGRRGAWTARGWAACAARATGALRPLGPSLTSVRRRVAARVAGQGSGPTSQQTTLADDASRRRERLLHAALPAKRRPKTPRSTPQGAVGWGVSSGLSRTALCWGVPKGVPRASPRGVPPGVAIIIRTRSPACSGVNRCVKLVISSAARLPLSAPTRKRGASGVHRPSSRGAAQSASCVQCAKCSAVECKCSGGCSAVWGLHAAASCGSSLQL